MNPRYKSYSQTVFMAVLLATFSLLTTSSYCQSPLVYVWTNQFPGLIGGTGDMNQSTNYDPNGVPQPMTPTADPVTGAFGDLIQFDGRTTGPLMITESGGTLVGFGGQSYTAGIRVELTPNQNSSVTIISPGGTSGGLRMNWFSVDGPNGSLVLGRDSTVDILDIVGGELNQQVSGFTNNSGTTSVINPDVRWRMGGAGFHPHIFAGVGNWNVRNHMRSANSSSIGVQIEGPGTVTWSGTNVGTRSVNWFDNLGTPLRVNGGTLIMKSTDLVSSDAGTVAIVHNGTLMKFDAQPSPGLITDPATIPGVISGSGPIQINAGVYTFAGASTFTGPINLTGGELIAGGTEVVGISGPFGQNGLISFNGGTLGWNLANAFDYSPRFDTAPGQIYNLDTGGSSPTLATGLTSVGGTLNKTGGGTLTLAGANTYSGLTTVGSGGQLLIQGTKSGTGNISVADGGALGVVENGSQVTPSNLSLGTATGAVLEFNNVTNHTTATLFPNTLTSVGTVTINVNSGHFRLIGDTFALLKWTTGSAPAVSLGFLAGAGGHLTTNGNEIDLVIDDPPFIWTDATANDTWNSTSINWEYSGSSTAWTNGHYALLDDTAGGTGAVTLSGSITPTNATINNSTITFAITSSAGNVIAGAGGITKNGNGTLTLPGGVNTYTGVTTVGGGILGVAVLANAGLPSDIGAANNGGTNLVLSGGGTLQYIGTGVSMNRLFTVGQNGGTLDNEGTGALVFNNSNGSILMSGNGPRTLTLSGPGAGDTMAPSIINHPAGTGLRKTGAGTWILTGTNTYASGTTLLEGSLQIGTGGQSGTIGNGNISTADGTGIDFNRAGTLVVPGSITGGGGVTNDGSGVTILANNNNYTGGTFINAGTLSVGNGGSAGSLAQAGPILNNGLLIFNSTGSYSYGPGAAGIISGSGNLVVSNGFIKAIGNNTYNGWTRIDAGATYQPVQGQDGAIASPTITNNGTLRIETQNTTAPGFAYGGPIVGSGRLQIGNNNNNVGIVTLTGANSYSGGTFIGGNELDLGDGATAGAGAIVGNIVFTNNFTISQDNARTVLFNRPAGDDFTFSGNITTNFASPQVNLGIIRLGSLALGGGGANMTLTGNNTYGGGTIVDVGQLTVGNGGSSGSIGSGPVTLNSSANLIINRSGSLSIPGAVSGVAGVTLIGPASVTMSSLGSSYLGATTISNGTLTVSSLGGELDVQGGTVIVQSTLVAANLNVTNDMNIGAGTVVATLNKTTAQSNTTYTVGGNINYTGGKLSLVTVGAALTPGDKFVIFSKPVTGGAAMPIVCPGATITNNLAVDGSVSVLTALPLPTTLTASLTGGTQFNISWPASWIGGVHLQGQTNALNVGFRSTNWVDVAGTSTTNVFSSPVNTNRATFYRMVIP